MWVSFPLAVQKELKSAAILDTSLTFDKWARVGNALFVFKKKIIEFVLIHHNECRSHENYFIWRALCTKFFGWLYLNIKWLFPDYEWIYSKARSSLDEGWVQTRNPPGGSLILTDIKLRESLYKNTWHHFILSDQWGFPCGTQRGFPLLLHLSLHELVIIVFFQLKAQPRWSCLFRRRA